MQPEQKITTGATAKPYTAVWVVRVRVEVLADE